MPPLGPRRSTPRSSRKGDNARHTPPPQQPPHLCPHPAGCCSAPRPARWPGGWCRGPWPAWLGAGASPAPSPWSAAGRSLCRGCSACNPKGHGGETTVIRAARRWAALGLGHRPSRLPGLSPLCCLGACRRPSPSLRAGLWGPQNIPKSRSHTQLWGGVWGVSARRGPSQGRGAGLEQS